MVTDELSSYYKLTERNLIMPETVKSKHYDVISFDSLNATEKILLENLPESRAMDQCRAMADSNLIFSTIFFIRESTHEQS